jgi:cysteine desulfurase family protein (TIGR01976 family)
MGYQVAAVRARFPALTEGAAHFDGPGGSQVPAAVADAVADTLRSAVANRGTTTTAERRADRIVVEARAALGDLLGVPARGVVFGRSMTALTYEFARAAAKQWSTGDEIVVTSLEHDANLRPWLQVAEQHGVIARWAEFDPATGELPAAAVAAQLTGHTRLVAVTAASNLLGTRPDVPAIAAAAHDVGAIVFVDGVHLTPHAAIDVPALGADVFVCSPYKFFGPHCGVLAAQPSLLATIRPDKLLPATDDVPERYELGTLPYELLAGTTAAVDFIAGLAPDDGDRRGRVLAAMALVEQHEGTLLQKLLDGLQSLPDVTTYGRPERRTPTVLFTVAGVAPQAVSEHLATRGVNAPAGSFYALEPALRLGLGEPGGVRAGLSPYTDEDDVERLLSALRELR